MPSRTETAANLPAQPPSSVAGGAAASITQPAQSATARATVPAGQSSGSTRPAHQVLLRVTADAWVEVRQQNGRALLRRIMKAGEVWPVPAEPDLILDTGNAAGLVLETDGVPIRLSGAKGGVVRNISLDANLLHSGAAVHSAH